MERADKIVGWLKEGKTYLVPTVLGEWLDTHGIADWPVVGVRHKDLEFGVNISHYHIDHRFVPISEWKRDNNTSVNESCNQPLRYAPWKCINACIILNDVKTPNGISVQDIMAGKKCSGSAVKGWICPHKQVWLGSQPATRGVITCPGHGLRIDAKTGRVL